MEACGEGRDCTGLVQPIQCEQEPAEVTGQESWPSCRNKLRPQAEQTAPSLCLPRGWRKKTTARRKSPRWTCSCRGCLTELPNAARDKRKDSRAVRTGSCTRRLGSSTERMRLVANGPGFRTFFFCIRLFLLNCARAWRGEVCLND